MAAYDPNPNPDLSGEGDSLSKQMQTDAGDASQGLSKSAAKNTAAGDHRKDEQQNWAATSAEEPKKLLTVWDLIDKKRKERGLPPLPRKQDWPRNLAKGSFSALPFIRDSH